MYQHQPTIHSTVLVAEGVLVPLMVDRLHDTMCFMSFGSAAPASSSSSYSAAVLPAVLKISTDAYDIIEQFDHHHSPERYLSVSYYFTPDSSSSAASSTSLDLGTTIFLQSIQQIQNYSTDAVFRDFLWTSSSIKDLSDDVCSVKGKDSAQVQAQEQLCEALLQDLLRVDAWSPFEQALTELSRSDGCGFKTMKFDVGKEVGNDVCVVLSEWVTVLLSIIHPSIVSTTATHHHHHTDSYTTALRYFAGTTNCSFTR